MKRCLFYLPKTSLSSRELYVDVVDHIHQWALKDIPNVLGFQFRFFPEVKQYHFDEYGRTSKVQELGYFTCYFKVDFSKENLVYKRELCTDENVAMEDSHSAHTPIIGMIVPYATIFAKRPVTTTLEHQLGVASTLLSDCFPDSLYPRNGFQFFVLAKIAPRLADEDDISYSSQFQHLLAQLFWHEKAYQKKQRQQTNLHFMAFEDFY